MLFTSNYSRHSIHPNAVAISASPPDYYKGKCYKTLAPTWDILNAFKNNQISQVEYAERYYCLLFQRNLDPHKVVSDLGEGAILLCYESPGEFCHRRLAANWIESHTGIKVYEFVEYERLKIKEQQDKHLDQFFAD